jgi:hypothetical protein
VHASTKRNNLICVSEAEQIEPVKDSMDEGAMPDDPGRERHIRIQIHCPENET